MVSVPFHAMDVLLRGVNDVARRGHAEGLDTGDVPEDRRKDGPGVREGAPGGAISSGEGVRCWRWSRFFLELKESNACGARTLIMDENFFQTTLQSPRSFPFYLHLVSNVLGHVNPITQFERIFYVIRPCEFRSPLGGPLNSLRTVLFFIDPLSFCARAILPASLLWQPVPRGLVPGRCTRLR